jgi:hypothetical protein
VRGTPIVSPQSDKKNSFGRIGERKVLKRSIDLIDPFDLTIGEKIFRAAKRLCIISAAAAVTLSALDLANIRSVENVAELVHADRQTFANLPNLIRGGIQSIALASPMPMPMPSAVAMIPRGEIAMTPHPSRSVAADPSIISDASPVAELAAAHLLDAVEVAMEAPPSWKNAGLPFSTGSVRETEKIILASVDTTPLPLPDVTPVSLPMSNAIPLDMVPMPRPAPGLPPPSPAELLHLEGKAYAKAERCLANAIYFEARGEPVSGQIAVAQVVMNRAFSGFYPNDVCAVIYQNAHRHLACQFTFACDGKSKAINERGAWARANRIAKQTLDGQLYVATVGASTHYHAIYVHPNWVREMHKLARYGIHNFYRPIAWGNGKDEPVWGTAALAQNKKK